MNATLLGTFSSIYYLTYSLALIPLGLLLDRVGPHRVFPICAFILSTAVAIFSFTSNFYVACILRMLIGASGACGFLGTIKLGTLLIKSRHFGQVVALATVSGIFGAVLGNLPMRYLFTQIGWRNGMLVLAGFGFFLTAALYRWLQAVSVASANAEQRQSIRKDLRLVLGNKQIWLVGIYAMLMYLPITVIGDLWGIPFISRAYDLPKEATAMIVSVMFIGVLLGSPAFVFISNWQESRKVPLIVGGIAACIANSLLVYGTGLPLWSMCIFFFAVGLFFGSKSIGFAIAVESLPRRVSGLATGVVNAFIMMNGVFSLPMVGWLLDYGKTHFFPPTEQYTYTLPNFVFALTIVPIGVFISIFLAFFTRETFPKTDD